jgi:hypothetical protein
MRIVQQGETPQRPLASRTISVAASLDHPTRFSYDPTASYDGGAPTSGGAHALTVLNVVARSALQ